ncbi:Gtr1/RagA G protein conserved region-domain-containing protein [Xylaria nigripes]|nr:Gtr1/RagA G protein conserved region-domain-containing protein [Xylaria nigripes]
MPSHLRARDASPERDGYERSAQAEAPTPAQLNLTRLFEQNQQRQRKNLVAKALEHPPDDSTKGKPRLLLMGQRRSGKSSISNVVFHKLRPDETLFLESTAHIKKDQLPSFMDFQVWDFPGQIDIFENPTIDIDAMFGEIGALIWVIDAQDDYMEAVTRLNVTILNLQRTYPNIKIEVFIHKVDGLSDDYKLDIQRDITLRIQDELSDHGFENAPVTFHLTSIYNHSIFEAFSKVIQKLVPRLGILETMLTNLCRTCRFEKAYLFDVMSKIYIATDSTPGDMSSYEICSDYIDVILDVTDVYNGAYDGWTRSEKYCEGLEGPPWNQKLEDQVASSRAESCIVLSDGNKPIILREVNKYLSLVAIMKEDSYDKMPLVDMNVEVVVQGLKDFFAITKPR